MPWKAVSFDFWKIDIFGCCIHVPVSLFKRPCFTFFFCCFWESSGISPSKRLSGLILSPLTLIICEHWNSLLLDVLYGTLPYLFTNLTNSGGDHAIIHVATMRSVHVTKHAACSRGMWPVHVASMRSCGQSKVKQTMSLICTEISPD